MGILIPDSALQYVILQRTDHLCPGHGRLVRRLVQLTPFYKSAVEAEAHRHGQQIKQRFSDEMTGEYESIRRWLPPRVSTILDIGCGIGGIDVLLFRHYERDAKLEFYELDKSTVDDHIHYGFHGQASFYNSLEATAQTLADNGIERQHVHLLEATGDCRIDLPGRVDLVISLLSWGFHYPVRTYLQRVYELMRVGGRLILDVRRHTDGLQALVQRFGSVRVIGQDRKRSRVVVDRESA